MTNVTVKKNGQKQTAHCKFALFACDFKTSSGFKKLRRRSVIGGYTELLCYGLGDKRSFQQAELHPASPWSILLKPKPKKVSRATYHPWTRNMREREHSK